ncbi:NAD(P)/FAD-dependent oxidoreductase, partial [Pseudonocardia sp.]|uniref:NAD(P)/FAD-dependent oxidoreductase n=1 Tax=Pseudonocardia sp. TaxID=60912 RepID=UPI0031FBF125
YDPWDQRLCVVPDADLFKAIKKDKAAVVTDRIARVTETGVALESGRTLDADVLVTATGLEVVACGGIDLRVDGEPVVPGEKVTYRGCLLSDVPNLAICIGYVNASWTLRADITARYVCRLLARMDARGAAVAVPRLPDGPMELRPLLDLSSGYVRRAIDVLPKQGTRSPWVLRQNYVADRVTTGLGSIDRDMEFRRRPARLVTDRTATMPVAGA